MCCKCNCGLDRDQVSYLSISVTKIVHNYENNCINLVLLFNLLNDSKFSLINFKGEIHNCTYIVPIPSWIADSLLYPIHEPWFYDSWISMSLNRYYVTYQKIRIMKFLLLWLITLQNCLLYKLAGKCS